LNLQAGDEGHIFGVVCPAGHQNYFDKREVCRKESIFMSVEDKTAHRQRLVCGYLGCKEVMIVKVDCEDYR